MLSNGHVKLAVFIAAVLLLGTSQAWPGATVDNSTYAELLAQYVSDGRVNYRGFKREEHKLDQYLTLLANVDVDKLSHNEKFAFYINAYNAWTIKLVLSGYPGITSIKDLGTFFKSPWKKKICRIDGDVITLDDIEHNILRPKFKDPRVHFAINCASLSCPPLNSKPYSGATLEQQLDADAKSFVNDSKSNYLTGDTLYVSKIFKWFSEDFNNDIIGFFIKYADADFKTALETKTSHIKMSYLPYDWSLNGT
jgi:hypothetical protein